MTKRSRLTTVGNLPMGVRLSVLGLTALLAVGLAGDRGVRSATNSGQDPLDLLDLQAKANAFIILDTSGSMAWTDESANQNENPGEDHFTSKMAQAKSVLLDVIEANQESVLFNFGQFSQGQRLRLQSRNRFTYVANSTESPGLATYDIPTNNVTSLSRSGSWQYTLKEDHAPEGLTGATVTYYRLLANRYYNGEVIHIDNWGNYCSTDATVSRTNPPSVTLVRQSGGCATGERSRGVFHWGGVSFDNWTDPDGTNSCGGYLAHVDITLPDDCGKTDQLTDYEPIGPYLQPSLLLDASGDILGYTEDASGNINTGTDTHTHGGVSAKGSTPIAYSLRDIRPTWDTLWSSVISTQSYRQASFAIVLSDGDDTCASNDSNVAALTAAYRAQDLYWAHDDGRPSSRFKTIVVAFGLGQSLTRANWIAYGGSGMSRATTGWGNGTRWATAPTAADVANCTSCIPAYSAQTKDQLKAALQAAINQGLTEGQFADRAVASDVYEYSSVVDSTIDTKYPDVRNLIQAPVLFQAGWELPGFLGHLTATQLTVDENGVERLYNHWDAGQRLLDQLSPALSTTDHTFAQLHGGASWETIGSSTAAIKRRIFTTTQNGVNDEYTPQNLVQNAAALEWERVALWPPDATVTNGDLDGDLGIGSMTFDQLRSDFGACDGDPAGTLPGRCSNAAQRLGQAKQEAREMILAFMAGAYSPRGAGSASNNAPARDGSGNIVYRARTWILADAAGAAPAIVIPPLGELGDAKFGKTEYGYYVTGVGTSGGLAIPAFDAGFGLARPDNDGNEQTSVSAGLIRPNLKPVMTVVYHPANDMLHAFRAGPCMPGSCNETGGEELWGFVPFDQLGKLKQRFLNPPSRDDHVYMMAAHARIGDVFVPGHFSVRLGGVPFEGEGVWRVLLVIGRGPGGKSLTTLDVTNPGQFSRAALETNPPVVVWNRGNPDTDDGTSTGTANGSGTDGSAYATMGETWSPAAIVPVDRADPPQFVLVLGSGYSDVAGEGSTVYELDAITGSVIASHDVGAGAGTLPNAVVAGPAGYQEELVAGVVDGSYALGATALGQAAYFGDLHGRLFRWDIVNAGTAPEILSERGANQPIGTAVSLGTAAGASAVETPAVFGETGNDTRVEESEGPFEMFALKETSPSSADLLWSKAFPDGFRGTVQPALVYTQDPNNASGNSANGVGLVAFFVGTRFVPAVTQCFSRYDSIIYMLEAFGGQAAFDLPGGGDNILLSDEKITGIATYRGSLFVSRGLGGEKSTPPRAKRRGEDDTQVKITMGPPSDSAAAGGGAGSLPFKFGSGVCR